MLQKKNNNGFDTEGGFYKIVEGDHIAYRYEVLQDIDKGAFGQVCRCFDHKEKCEVAIKINRNTPFDHNNSRVEIGILKKIKNGIIEDDKTSIMRQCLGRIVDFKDSLYFRNHYVSNSTFFSYL